MHRFLIHCVLVVTLSLVAAVEAFGESVIMLGNAGDGSADVSGNVGDLFFSQLRAGVHGNDVRGVAPIFFFALPTVSSPASITGAQLDFQYLGISQFTITTVPNFNADLFGIGARSTPTILGTDYYDGSAASSSDTLIAQGFITPSTAAGNLQASGPNLLNFITSLYNPDGTPKAAYVAFRINPDMDLPPLSGPYRGYEIASAENTDAGGAYVPRLTMEVVPEPSTFTLTAIGVSILGGWAWRRRKLRSQPTKV